MKSSGSLPLAILLVCALVGLDRPIRAAVAINEFVASNGSILADEDGDFESWIELYNHGNSTVQLAGFGLSDDPEEPYRWVFPETTIGPGEFLVLWASGKQRSQSGAPLHTNFSVSSRGETLSLTNPSGETVDTVDATPLPRDHSYGRVPDGVGGWFYFDSPTPGAANTTTPFAEWLAPPTFSRDGRFYSAEFLLELQHSDPDAMILYTVDGSEPGIESIGGVPFNYKRTYPMLPRSSGETVNYGTFFQDEMRSHVYDPSAPIQVVDRREEPNRISMIPTEIRWSYEFPAIYMPETPVFKGTVVRARAVKEGAIASPAITHTYFVTPEGDSRYTLPVLSHAVPANHLFDYHNGISVPGVRYDEFVQEYHESLDGESADWPPAYLRPGNFNETGRNWEVPGHMEVFVPHGGRVHSQNLGFRIHGGYSRTIPNKAFRIYSRRDYDPDGRMHYAFFEDLRDIYGRRIERFNRLILRTAGNDWLSYRYADALAQAIARPIGLDDQHTLPAIQFINGEFWGHVNVRERIDRFYIESRHLIDPDDVAYISYGHGFSEEWEFVPDLVEGTPSDLSDYIALHAHVTEQDMSNSNHFEHVAEAIDIDHFILYNVACIYLGNMDWPHNNIDFWRKRIPDRRPGAPATHDGRWRWILKDFDMGFARHHPNNPAQMYDTLGWAIRTAPLSKHENPEWIKGTFFLRGLLKNPAFKARFINAFADHINTTFQPARFTTLATAFESAIGPYRGGEHQQRWIFGRPADFDSAGWHTSFAELRRGFMLDKIQEYFAVGAPVEITLDVSDPSRGTLRVNTIHLDQHTVGLPNPGAPYPFKATYFAGHPIEITALPNTGYRFVGWKEFPEHPDPAITISPEAGLSLTAIFARGMPEILIAYWNFNDSEYLLEPAFAWTPVGLSISPGADADVTDGGGNGFAGRNARMGDPAGRHLRIDSPIGSTLEIRAPTDGFRDPVLTYETRRSGQGAGAHLISYSTNGIHWEEFGEIILFDEAPISHRLDFSAIEEVSDNPEFRVRIQFLRRGGGTTGNNRIDNVTLEGRENVTGSIFERSESSLNLGYGWKWNTLGYFYDRYFPYVYSFGLEDWIYVVGSDESSYYFWLFTDEQWGWTGSGHYPDYFVFPNG